MSVVTPDTNPDRLTQKLYTLTTTVPPNSPQGQRLAFRVCSFLGCPTSRLQSPQQIGSTVFSLLKNIYQTSIKIVFACTECANFFILLAIFPWSYVKCWFVSSFCFFLKLKFREKLRVPYKALFLTASFGCL